MMITSLACTLTVTLLFTVLYVLNRCKDRSMYLTDSVERRQMMVREGRR